MTQIFTVLCVTSVSDGIICIRQAAECITVQETGIDQILSKIDLDIVVLQFVLQGRDEIFSCGFHHNMCSSSG